jgi:pimeloyl-ACP methyl ester carboxylesterase
MQNLFANDEGNKFPLVMVHGFLGSSIMWDPQIQDFKKNFRVIAPDLPGFGYSEKVKPCNSINSMAKSILDLIEQKNINKFHLLGHSMGGMIVQEITKLAGEKIEKLICYGTGPRGEMPERFETIDRSRERLKIDGLTTTAHRIAKTWFVKEDKSKYFDLCSKAGKLTTMEAADAALVAMKNWSGLENLKNIKNKTLIIWGDKDRAYNRNQVDTLNENILDSNLIIFEGCSHNVHLENSEKFNKTVCDFLL